MSEVLSQLRQRPIPWFSPIHWQAPGGKGQGIRQAAQTGRRMFPSKTDLNWIEYCLQGGERLSEEVVPDFSQNLHAIFTYMRARRWEGRKKGKNSVITCRRGQETVPRQTEHGMVVRGSSLSTFDPEVLLQKTWDWMGKLDRKYAFSPLIQKRELNFEKHAITAVVTRMVTLSGPVLDYLSISYLMSRRYYPILQLRQARYLGSKSHR